MTRTLHYLGQAARHGLILTLTFSRCGHSSSHRTAELASRMGHGRHVEDMRFICSNCGARNVSSVWDFPERP